MLIQNATLSGWIASLPLRSAAEAIAQTSLFLGAVVAVAAILEWRGRGERARYLTRGFLNDLVYALFYRGGFYRVLVFGVIR